MKTSVAVGTSVLALLTNAVVAAVTSNSTSTSATGTATEACAVVSASWAAQIAATATPTVSASLAYDCLNSAAINKEAALKFVNELEPYLEWQSDSAWKKNPPADYFYPAYDVFAELAKIKAAIEADEYPTEYAWQADLYKKVFGPGHDGHLVVYPDLLSRAIEFGRPFALVSISEDGSSLPVIKVYEDVISSPDTASVVKLINGIDAATYVSDWIFQVSGNQDADAAYNSMFFEKSYVAELASFGYFQSGGRVRYVYPGDTTSFTFENGTSVELDNVGRIKGNFAGVTDGPSLFAKFCPAAVPAASTTASATATPAPTSSSAAVPTAVPGYPAPVIISSDSVVSGYFLSEAGFEDVAVLVMLSFSPDDPPEFQQVVQDFFAASVKAGKTKLVVDVQVNGGGYIYQGYDTFRQIFPDIVQEGLGCWRNSAGFKAVSEVFSARCADYDPLTSSEELIYECNSVYNWRYDLDESLQNFTSFDDKFGPVEHNGDEYTDVMQWNFDNEIDTINSTYGIGYDVTGYGSRRNFTRPFGGPENVVVLLDGYCASTCTLFSQFMKWNAGVKSIALGGRPKEGLIQGVGGVKGSQSYGFANVYSNVQAALNETEDADLIAEFSRYTTYVVDRSSAASLNVKDEILRDNLDDGTPAQYVAEYSDCRLYWTEDMVKDVSSVWKSAASAAFKGGACAAGSIEYPQTYERRRSRLLPPRFTSPKQHVPVEKTVDKREIGETRNKFLATQFMKVVD
ncbi:uncharacterized protein BCR38DRAFT_414810 [Pseudomassariella vexata]|uniref:CPAF-like PDZ domain-containing protein n=1 Tax=Pseudomassariella vexata TaxID=1141098 RepID=A0A1Y2D8T1_9PEZI|nr:uncharacterized protein BCR38DRAFT_414810 [Pseudomassariella vexata]ORY55627.1 hypothetical protein BCR38DRAFT_414810 [Pseudomassariella vexata]